MTIEMHQKKRTQEVSKNAWNIRNERHGQSKAKRSSPQNQSASYQKSKPILAKKN
jgi:hypothetical protein